MTGTGPGDHFPADDGDRMPPDEDDSYGFGDDDEDEWEFEATFRPVAGGAACTFDPSQARIIRSLVGEVAELISESSESPVSGMTAAPDGGVADEEPTRDDAPQDGSGQADELEMLLGLSGRSELPDDPVLARLLPDAYSHDPEAAADFRRYTEEGLRAGKLKTAETVLATLPPAGGEVVLNQEECQAWLRALNDVRLALGVRLDITDEQQGLAEDVSEDDPKAAYLMLYQWLSYLQDSLVDALT